MHTTCRQDNCILNLHVHQGSISVSIRHDSSAIQSADNDPSKTRPVVGTTSHHSTLLNQTLICISYFILVLITVKCETSNSYILSRTRDPTSWDDFGFPRNISR